MAPPSKDIPVGEHSSAPPYPYKGEGATADIKSSLRNSFREGIFGSVMTGCTEQYLAPCALALGASTGAIGILAALTNLVASWSQLLTTFWVRHFASRRQFIARGAAAQALMLLPLAWIAYFPAEHPVPFFVAAAVLFVSCGAMIAPAWGSLVTDHVDSESRGKYFGWRNQRLGLIVVGSGMLAGLVLYLTHGRSPVLGFTVLFIVAMLARLFSAYFLTCMADIPLTVSREHDFTLWMFLRRFRESNFVHFVVFVAAMTFSTQIAAPFFSVYMLRDLHFNYLVYTALVLGAQLTTLGGMRVWGEHADRVGNARVLRLTSLLVPFIPCAWLLSTNPLYLMMVEIFAGFVWGGFNLAASNFIYDAVSAPKRIRCIAYFNVFNGTALAAGALLGGALAAHMPRLAGHGLLSLFLLSGILRWLVVIFLGPRVREVRPAQTVSSMDLFFSVVGIRSVLGSARRQEIG